MLGRRRRGVGLDASASGSSGSTTTSWRPAEMKRVYDELHEVELAGLERLDDRGRDRARVLVGRGLSLNPANAASIG